MVNKLKDLISSTHNIRNVCVGGHARHGKTTLVGSVISSGRIFGHDEKATDKIAKLVDYEEELRNSIKSVVASTSWHLPKKMLRGYEGELETNTFLINLIDSPGHPDFGAEVSSSIRVTDGVIVIVDCIEGVSMQTEKFIRLALAEKCRPVLIISKFDKLDELNVEGERAYSICNTIINEINSIIARYQDPALGDARVYPQKGTVGFCSSVQGWAFNLVHLSELHALKLGRNRSEVMSRLWGENFFDTKTRKWSKEHNGSKTCKRGFVGYCYSFIREIIHLCKKDENERWPLLMKKLAGYRIKLKPADEHLEGEALIKQVLGSLLPCDVILGMIILHLPSPVSSQKYRVDTLYDGPSQDVYATAIRNCDVSGCLMMFVSKMMPSSDHKHLFAFGRIYSGKVKTGEQVQVMGPNFIPGEAMDLRLHNITEIDIWVGERQVSIEEVPCGNLVALLGFDTTKFKTCTLTNTENPNAYPFRKMNLSIEPVVYVSIECEKNVDVKKFNRAIERLDICDHGVICQNDKDGNKLKKVIVGLGMIHLQYCLRYLEDHCLDGCQVQINDPLVCYRESVSGSSSHSFVRRSTNGQKNFIHMKAWPLDTHIVEAIQDGKISETSPTELVNKFNWDIELAENVLCFGPDRNGPNMLVGKKGFDYPDDVKKNIIDAFKIALNKGPLAGETMFGVGFEVCDLNFHSEPKKRGKKEITKVTERAIYAAHLSAKPCVLEPIYLLEILVQPSSYYNAMDAVKQRRGSSIEGLECEEPCFSKLKALVPVSDSFDFPNKVRASTSDKASLQAEFHHWNIIESDPLDDDSPAEIHLKLIRERKGLTENMKKLSEYQD